MGNTFLILALFSLFSTSSLAQTIQVKSLNQGGCWIKEDVGNVRVVSFNQGISVELNDESLSKIHELDLPTRFEGPLEVRAFCSSHGMSLVLNAKEDTKRYCVWLNIEKNGFSTQSVGLTDNAGKCDGYRPGVLILTTPNSGIERDKLLRQLERRDVGANFHSFEILSSGLIKINLNDEDYGSEEKFISKFEKIDSVKYAEKSFFYHPIGEWSDLESLGR